MRICLNLDTGNRSVNFYIPQLLYWFKTFYMCQSQIWDRNHLFRGSRWRGCLLLAHEHGGKQSITYHLYIFGAINSIFWFQSVPSAARPSKQRVTFGNRLEGHNLGPLAGYLVHNLLSLQVDLPNTGTPDKMWTSLSLEVDSDSCSYQSSIEFRECNQKWNLYSALHLHGQNSSFDYPNISSTKTTIT
jgi:hypothetical protein